jgi:hypothetical protein
MRLLRAEIADARKRQAAGPRRMLVAMAVVILPLWVLTILTSKLFVLPTLVWLSLAALIGFWSARDVRESFVARVVPLENALGANGVEEIRVAAAEMVEFEEIGDVGACYAFQVEPDKILIVQGQDYSATRRFPNTDFSIVITQDSNGEPREIGVHKRGAKMAPARVISAETQKRLRFPLHLEVLQGRLADIEGILGSPR